MAASSSEPPTTDWSRPPDFSALNTYGWAYDSSFTVDENYLDLACLVARNSTAKDGHMGCALVRDIPIGCGDGKPEAARGHVELCTINSSLFGAHRSDCHAEANAVCELATRGVAARGMSCYVTRPPCVACYKLLAMAGVKRIVAPQPLDSADCTASAAALGIECITLRDTDSRAERRQGLAKSNEDMDRIRALREERKRLKKEHGFGKKSIQASHRARASEGAAEALSVSDGQQQHDVAGCDGEIMETEMNA